MSNLLTPQQLKSLESDTVTVSEPTMFRDVVISIRDKKFGLVEICYCLWGEQYRVVVVEEGRVAVLFEEELNRPDRVELKKLVEGVLEKANTEETDESNK